MVVKNLTTNKTPWPKFQSLQAFKEKSILILLKQRQKILIPTSFYDTRITLILKPYKDSIWEETIDFPQEYRQILFKFSKLNSIKFSKYNSNAI